MQQTMIDYDKQSINRTNNDSMIEIADAVLQKAAKEGMDEFIQAFTIDTEK